jgi:hypothetical protein
MSKKAFAKIERGLKDAIEGRYIEYTPEEIAIIQEQRLRCDALAKAEVERRGIGVHPRIKAMREKPQP